MPINQKEESKIIEKMSNRYTETFCSRGNICGSQTWKYPQLHF